MQRIRKKWRPILTTERKNQHESIGPFRWNGGPINLSVFLDIRTFFRNMNAFAFFSTDPSVTWDPEFSRTRTYLHLKDNHLIHLNFSYGKIYRAISKIILGIQNSDSGSSRIVPYLIIDIFQEHRTTYIWKGLIFLHLNFQH